MSGTHHRTWQQYHVGHLNVTVQLDSTAEGRSVERHRQMAKVARQLIATMDAEQIPATWVVSDPAYSAATSLILKSPVNHELAILGDANWVGPTAGRTRFARELVRRISQARATGLNVTTLVPNVAPIDEHIDLVVKQQITAVVGLRMPAATRQSLEPRAIHYGVWELPVSASLPMKATWFRSGERSIWRGIQRTAKEAGAFHLLIDAAAIAAAGQRDDSSVAWLMRRVATLRDRGCVWKHCGPPPRDYLMFRPFRRSGPFSAGRRKAAAVQRGEYPG
jgi:hypothetical protein